MAKTKLPPVKILDDWRAEAIGILPQWQGPVPGMGVSRPDMGVPQPVIADRSAPIDLVEVPNAIAMRKRAALSGWGEPQNLSQTVDASRIQSFIRAAERGDTWQLFTLFRDMLCGYTHLQGEFQKRKLTVVGQPHDLVPAREKNADDKKACAVINEMIDHCDNWQDGLDHLLDATLWPAAAAEKLFAPVAVSEQDDYEFPVRFRLRKIDPVSPTVFCYMVPYVASGVGMSSMTGMANPPLSNGLVGGAENTLAWDADEWEPRLRFYEVFENGYPNRSLSSTYRPEKARHVIHRGSNLSKTIPDNFGAHLRPISGWWFLAACGRDWFGRYMQRWAHPFIVGKVDAQQKDTVQFMQQALSLSVEIGGLVIDKEAEAQLIQAASLNGAEGYKLFLDVCNDEISKIVVGQTTSANPKSTGMGSGVAKQHEQVRQDIRESDMLKLSTTLAKQVFAHYLHINGYKGRVAGIIWGGKDISEVKQLAASMRDFYNAGLEAADDGVKVISKNIGFPLRRMKNPPGQGGANNQPND